MVYQGVFERVGNTPLVRLSAFAKAQDLKASLFAKLEGANPAGSAKDRVAQFILNDLQERGAITKDTVIVEPTSGNTGIALACLCAARGVRCIIVMPESMSAERRALIAAYGGELVLTSAEFGMAGAIAEAERLCKTLPHAVLAGQFENAQNPRAHYETTGPEIFRDLEGAVDGFIAGVGTGGTISGVGRFLKEQDPAVHVVAVEPADSPVLSGGAAGAHPLQGIGAGFVPKVLDTSVYDEVLTVTGEEAFSACRTLAKEEGLLVGISSGAALSAAVRICKRAENQGKNFVVLLPDLGERYLSCKLF